MYPFQSAEYSQSQIGLPSGQPESFRLIQEPQHPLPISLSWRCTARLADLFLSLLYSLSSTRLSFCISAVPNLLECQQESGQFAS